MAAVIAGLSCVVDDAHETGGVMNKQGMPTRHGVSWLDELSIRRRIVALTLTILLPVAAILVWFLAADLQHARNDAHQMVRNLATGTAKNLLHRLSHAEAVLGRLAVRPRVRAIDPDNCDPIVAEYIELEPQYLNLAVSDASGNIICSYRYRPASQLTAAEFPWFERALHSGRFEVSEVFTGPVSGRHVIALTHPIRDAAGAVIGLLILPVDLSMLSHQLLELTPENAIVSVLDRERTLLMRSSHFNTYVGQRPGSNEPDPAGGAREGLVTAVGRDGVPRLFAFVTLPGVDWRVSAGLPTADVYAHFDATLVRILGIGLGLSALAIGLAWRLSAAIVRPIADLERTAARVAAGQDTVRAEIGGPPEIRSVARQFNQMLDARALSDARLQGIFETASDAILTVDESQTIVMANTAAARMLRCPLDELTGAPLARFIPERYRANHGRDVHEFGAGEVSARRMGHQREVMALRADGEEFPIEAAISYLSVGGQRLYTVIHRDISERRQAQADLESSHVDLKRLVTALDHIQERERKRIARELHDDLQQTLAAIKIDAGEIGSQLDSAPARIPPLVARIDTLAAAAIASTRRIINDLRPQMLEELGLVASLEALATQFAQRIGVACEVEAVGWAAVDGALRSDVATCLYRVAQESLNNVAQHAQASRVSVRLTSLADGGLRLCLRDDGQGMGAGDRRKARSFGLLGMNERVHAVGGVLRIESRPGAGTVIDVEIARAAHASAPAPVSVS
jgi:PAS domain S-box-containing protein